LIIFSLVIALAAPSSHAAQRSVPPDKKLPSDVDPTKFYGQSWAVVIGINKYEKWSRLESAVNDAGAVAARLSELGFKVIKLIDGEATRFKIAHALGYYLPKNVKRNDRVLIFFAGHGQTVETFDGSQLGYIVPVDAAKDDMTTALSMKPVRKTGWQTATTTTNWSRLTAMTCS